MSDRALESTDRQNLTQRVEEPLLPIQRLWENGIDENLKQAMLNGGHKICTNCGLKIREGHSCD